MAKPILLYKVIDEVLAIEYTSELLSLNNNETSETWINSPGGSLTHGWSMVAALASREGGNNAIVTGDASSFAFFMLLFMNNVKAFDTSRFMIHRAASMWEEVLTGDELKDIEARNDLIREKIEAKLNEKEFSAITGKTFDDIFSMDDRLDVTITASQAVQIGLIDEVIIMDVAKRNKIESAYINNIAALAINNNKIKKNMGLFSKEKPIFLAEIGSKQCAYSTLEEGKEIKAIGSDNEVISGTFESGDKKVTVVENKITAVSSIDPQAKRIEALEAKITSLAEALEAKVQTAEPATKVDDSKVTALEAKVGELTAILEKAKLTASKPKLPQAEFKQESKEVELSAKQRLKAKRKETK